MAVLAVAGVAVASLLLGARLSTAATSRPAEGSPEALFTRRMIEHHAQAVRMSALVLERTDDPAIDALALDVLLTQQQQVGRMSGWLSAWGLSQAAPASRSEGQATHGTAGSAPGGGAHEGPMRGMATDAQLAALEDATGVDAERLYLELMIPHHRGAITMADAVLAEAREPEVRRLASTVLRSQAAEVEYLQELLRERTAAAPRNG